MREEGHQGHEKEGGASNPQGKTRMWHVAFQSANDGGIVGHSPFSPGYGVIEGREGKSKERDLRV